METVTPTGTVIAAQGAVIDVRFAGGAPLPAVDTALLVDWDRPEPLLLEVHSHLDAATVRAVALQATAGLSRDTAVRATGAPIRVPVGEAVLGRLLDVTGAVRDNGAALPPCPFTRMSLRMPRCSREPATSCTTAYRVAALMLTVPAKSLCSWEQAMVMGGSNMRS